MTHDHTPRRATDLRPVPAHVERWLADLAREDQPTVVADYHRRKQIPLEERVRGAA